MMYFKDRSQSQPKMYKLILVKIKNYCNPHLLRDPLPLLSVYAESFVLSSLINPIHLLLWVFADLWILFFDSTNKNLGSHFIVKDLNPMSGFPAWGSDRETGNPLGIWPWSPVEFDYRTSTELGETETPVLEGTNKILCTPRHRKIEGRRRRGGQGMRWLNGITNSHGHEFEQALGVGEGRGSLECCSPWDLRVRHDWETELNWRPRENEQWPHRRPNQNYLLVLEGLLWRCGLAGAHHRDRDTGSSGPGRSPLV